ncbi:hypothetical protein Eistla_gp3 [Pelagibacter phage Eistla EXVC025P]|nr:hypothetical protein Eistla_gp3 [Pelagibacter phage Eistla EXVC025P]
MSKLIGQAIKEINPNAEFICEEFNLDNIQWLNGTTPIAKADIEVKIAELDTADETAKQADATNKANGNQKLLDLGLSQAEATALTGYTPPVAE